MKFNLSKICYSVVDRKKNIIFPSKLNPKLAELIGIHIGDGYLGYRSSRKEYLIQCMGNPLKEKGHYDNFIYSAWKELFNINLRLFYHPSGC